MAGKKFFDLEEQILSLRELTKYPILMLDKTSTTSEFLHQLFVKNGLSLTPEAELSSNDLLLDFAHIGLGITVVPDYVLKHRQKEFYPLQLKETIPARKLLLAYQSQLLPSPACEKFLRYLLPDLQL